MISLASIPAPGATETVILSGNLTDIQIMVWKDMVKGKPITQAEIIPETLWKTE